MPSPESPKAVLQRYGLFAKKSFGQSFLADARLAAQIAAHAAGSEATGSVLEIGAGLGALTIPLLDEFTHVIAVERDRDLVPVLRELFAAELESGRLSLEQADAQSLDFLSLFQGRPEPWVVAGNLPYQLTGVLLRKVTGMARALRRAAFLVQLEVADRLVARPSAPDYGALSVFVQAQYEPRRVFVVRRGAFYPQPRVDSALVVLSSRESPLCEETTAFRDVVHAAFQKRRKTLRNAWRGLLSRSDREIQEAAARANIDLDARGETLDVSAFARMSVEVSR
jgi:16S rRNA (adenine1518-N6/adenine1519-N6)-dimethyltransferase